MNSKRCKKLRKIARRLAGDRSTTEYTKRETIKYGVGIDEEGKLERTPYISTTLLVASDCPRGIYRALKRSHKESRQ